jgi:glycolate oxidase iron-sulfur subunit
MDSPRGRIYLMKAHSEGRLPLSGTIVEHFDRCLGCLACVTACPSGVKYDVLIEQTRAEIERTVSRSVYDRLFRALIFALFPYPSRLRWLGLVQLAYERSGLRWLLRRAGVFRLLPARLRQLEALAPSLSWSQLRARLPTFSPAQGPRPRSSSSLRRLRSWPSCWWPSGSHPS